jgi:hypothetical protein
MHSLRAIGKTTAACLSVWIVSIIATPQLHAQEINNSLSAAQQLENLDTISIQNVNWGIGDAVNSDIETVNPDSFVETGNIQPEFDLEFEVNWTTTGDQKDTNASIDVINF